MSQYQSFFISASGNSSQCDEINHFLRSHVVIRTVENIINSGSNCGIQILVEYKDVQQSGEKTGRQKIDWRASLATDEQRELFDKLKDFAEVLFSEYQKILNEKKSPEAQNATDKESQNEADSIPF
ncbi:MAG: hypothetical protein MR424_13750 [Treponema sp.]|nr:hypothetical protein [Treponema sp.]